MLIVSDTTPLHYLILIDQADLLPQLFSEILIPTAVVSEMSHERTPLTVKAWMASPPEWLRVQSPSAETVRGVAGLDKGETEAIALAIDTNADALLLDDRKGVREAVKRNLLVISTLGILELASARNLIIFGDVLADLKQTNFWMPPQELLDEIMERDAAIKRKFN